MAGYTAFQPGYGGGGLAAAAGFGNRRSRAFGFGGGLAGLFGGSHGYGSPTSPIVTPPPIRNRFTRPQNPSGALINALRNPALNGGGANTAPTAKAADVYDINTDPGYQQAQALVGLSNADATAAAQKQIKDLLIGYGDANLASKLGFGADIAKAAGGNPNSTTGQLRTQRDRNLKTLEDQLNSANLSYSGYRVDQEKQSAQDYQNALATAAGQVQSQIAAIQDALNQAMAANNWQLYQAAQQAAANGAGTAPSPAGSSDPSGSSLLDWVNYLNNQ